MVVNSLGTPLIVISKKHLGSGMIPRPCHIAQIARVPLEGAGAGFTCTPSTSSSSQCVCNRSRSVRSGGLCRLDLYWFGIDMVSSRSAATTTISSATCFLIPSNHPPSLSVYPASPHPRRLLLPIPLMCDVSGEHPKPCM